ncbi:D-alanyl-D-alanine carboxypeptidase family protein [Alkalicoccobacillus porphyridii]|uniref:D-alanyl-D-alanine carboxypeptidase n=1 Tax=Alkalicoccobacillus porphyridii TaxID=2597270 RepID=A0A554A2F7_9BACI|nr:D-alanyl-D-alanine carboxypeptidase family protein [Alkalicoccobacillus porphyridii]TSB47836.1 D-alanyl-D-alanine carboxypeptidase [Alkalicoccobacillus porphyridii]
MKSLMAVTSFGFGLFLFINATTTMYHGPALVLDVNQDKIFMEQDMDVPVPVASISKLMTEYILFEYIESGELNWADSVKVSKEAAEKEGVRVNISEGDRISVHDLYMSMLLPSANNATAAVAEHIAGSETIFTERMNEKAQELGLLHSRFVNSTGLTEARGESNVMSARDVATLAHALITEYPQVLKDTSKPSYVLEHFNERIQTTNHMLTKPGLAFEGLDGLKTGFTDAAGYCFVGTAEREGQRYITVVLGTPHFDSRFVETQKLMSMAFNEMYIPSLDASIVTLKEARHTLWN